MIKRQATNKPLPSLVNSAQNEHLNVTEAIRADAPITSVKSVAKSINFENAADGAYIIRKPIVLKEHLGQDSWYLYDNEHILRILESDQNQWHVSLLTLFITGSDTTSISLRYYDKSLNYKIKSDATSLPIPYIKKILKVYNAPDHTLLSVILNTQEFAATTSDQLVYPATHYQVRNQYEVYRFIKIYKNTDTEIDTDWIVEIVHPEFNTITSGTDVGNANSLDINLLLDNPYAVRDLYGYGYNSVTKILAYVPLQYSKSEINELPVYSLTEDNPFIYNNTQKGFKVLVSSNPVDIYGKMIVLKACLTTALTKLKYYCCWEQSANGIDWEVCPEFVEKFSTNTENTIADKLVSDITSAEFEKIAYDDSLDKAATYLVTKNMVLINPKAYTSNTPTELNETDLIKNRPDILILTNPNLNMYYRFQVYVDTGKTSPVPSTIDKTLTKSYFETIGNEETNLDDLGKFTYQTFLGNGKDTDVGEDETPQDHLPELVNGSILLYESDDTSKFGNYIVVTCKEPLYTLKSIKIVLDNKTYHAADEDHEQEYYTEKGSILQYKAYSVGATITNNTNISYGTTTTLVGANESISIPWTNTTPYTIMIANNSKYRESTLGSDKPFQYRTKIKTIEVNYTVASGTQSTSIYLTSTTGNYQIPYSKTTEYLEDLSLNRKQLFNSDIYYYKEQFLFYGTNNLFVTDLGSSIIKLMNTMTFGLDVTAVISYRNYILAFTESSITLLKYNNETGTYDSKLLTSAIGVPKVDAKTIMVILNSIYFKSGFRVYRLIPNLYAAADDILNIHTVSGPVDKILDDVLSLNTEISNFTYADANNYMLFIPLNLTEGNKSVTYEFRYDFTKKLWTIQQYPILATGIEVQTITEAYMKTSSALYYFKEDLNILLNTTLIQDFSNVGYEDNGVSYVIGGSYTLLNNETTIKTFAYGHSQYSSMSDIYDYIPYGDYLTKSLTELYIEINTKTKEANNLFEDYVTPISFQIDFGQKSSNYTVDKQFLESKLLFTTLHVKDIFPVTLTISTDGIQRPLHWDINTDSALWKNSLVQVGTLSTDFGIQDQDYNGIFRQLIVKYSGKGKTIRHLINGITKTKFKFYSMDVRSRVLPVKQ